MKNVFSICILFIVFTAKGQTFEFDSVGVKKMQIGTIIQKSDVFIIRIGQGNSIQDFYAFNLDESYKIEGQRVLFNGIVGRIPATVRMVGTPLQLTSIRKLYSTKPNKEDLDKRQNELKNDAILTQSTFDSVGYINKAQGKIILINEVYLIETNINGSIQRYYAESLPTDFKIVNLSVTFTAILGKTFPNTRVMGTPIYLKEISAVDAVTISADQIQEPMKDFFPIDSVAFLPETKGTIKLMATEPDVYVIEIAEQGGIRRFMPALLPEQFKVDKLAVIFSGNIGKIPANVRMMGTPFELQIIRLYQSEK